MPAAEAQLSVVMKGKGGNYGKPHPVEIMEGAKASPDSLLSPPAAASLSYSESNMFKGRPQSFSCIIKRAVLVCNPGLGILHLSLVRIRQLYSGVCQSRPVRNERELLRSETLGKAI